MQELKEKHQPSEGTLTYPPNHNAAVGKIQELKKEHQSSKGTSMYPTNLTATIGDTQELKKEHQPSEGTLTYPTNHTAAIGDTQELKKQHQPSQDTSTKAETYLVPQQTHRSVPTLNKPHTDTSATPSIDSFNHSTSSQHSEQSESKHQYVQDASNKPEKLPVNSLANPSNKDENSRNLDSKEQSMIYQNGAPELTTKTNKSEHDKVIEGLDNHSQSTAKSSP